MLPNPARGMAPVTPLPAGFVKGDRVVGITPSPLWSSVSIIDRDKAMRSNAIASFE